MKPAVAPERLAPAAPDRSRTRPSPTSSRRATARGVSVFDPTPLLLGPEAYLATDTHWRPEAMERVAAALARRLEEQGALAPAAPVRYARAARPARHFGDLDACS